MEYLFPSNTSLPRVLQREPVHRPRTLSRDLASVSTVDKDGHPLLLSEVQILATEYSHDRRLHGLTLLEWPLHYWSGRCGLKKTVPQPKRMAVDSDDTISVVSESNPFHRFERATDPTAR